MKTQAEGIDKIPSPDKTIILTIGKPAPYSGVFMSEDQFRFFKTQELELEMIKERPFESHSNGWLWFIVGASFGAVAVSIGK
jgi:hypothetical protein